MLNIEGISDNRIVLIDDEPELLDLLETVLAKEGFQHIGKASSGRGGIELCREMKPDIIILDIMLPDIDGFEVCRQLREFTYAPVLFLSAKSDDVDKLLGLGIGGDDYITKPFSPREVAFRVKAQLRRNQFYETGRSAVDSKQVLTFGDVEIDAAKGEVTKSGQEVVLTAKEFQLLVYMALHPNQILSKRKLCDEVWGDEYIGYDNTIMVHIRHLREKIEDQPSQPNYIKTIKGLGYKLVTRGE